MKTIIAIAAVLSFTLAGRSESSSVQYNWSDLAISGKIPSGTVVTVDGREALKIENTSDSPLHATLLTIEHPYITTQVYQLTGEIRYDSVQGEGYLELWNFFPPPRPGLPPGQYFSRTLADTGPMGKITGTSDWREFILPFNSTGAPRPDQSIQALVPMEKAEQYRHVVELIADLRKQYINLRSIYPLHNSLVVEKQAQIDKQQALKKELEQEVPALADNPAVPGAPTRLQLNLVLPGRGTVYLGMVKLAQIPNLMLAVAGIHSNAWWSNRDAGLVGGFGGAIFGTAIGLLCVLAALGKARRLTKVSFILFTVLGFSALMASFVALARHQPYAVWYPLLLLGFMLATMCPFLLWLFSYLLARRSREAELRRMHALDVSGA